jgi:outer membrane protein assembly factor BamE (lipoprotein component of BamABCDE complex)
MEDVVLPICDHAGDRFRGDSRYISLGPRRENKFGQGAMIKLAIVLLFSITTACAEAPPPKFMMEENRAKLIVGQSTEADVRNILGSPQHVSVETNRDGSTTVWIYQYIRQGTYELIPALREELSKPALHSILKIYFNHRRIVEKIDRMDQEIRSPEEGGILVPF